MTVKNSTEKEGRKQYVPLYKLVSNYTRCASIKKASFGLYLGGFLSIDCARVRENGFYVALHVTYYMCDGGRKEGSSHVSSGLLKWRPSLMAYYKGGEGAR